jgi:adenylate kinase
MNVLLFGPPGAGKGTQSAFLVERLDMRHISTGDLFRKAIKENSALGMEAKKFIDLGQLVPDTVTIGMVKEVLQTLKGQGFILDGFPRNVIQAKSLEVLLAELKLNLDKALFLEVPHDALIARLTGRRVCRSCGTTYHVEFSPPKKSGVCDNCGGEVYQRTDDKAEAIGTRLKVYTESTAPLKDYYQHQGKLVDIDGQGELESIFSRIKSVFKH